MSIEDLHRLPSRDTSPDPENVPFRCRPNITQEALDALLDRMSAAEKAVVIAHKETTKAQEHLKNADVLLKGLVEEHGQPWNNEAEMKQGRELRISPMALASVPGITGINYDGCLHTGYRILISR